VFHRYLVGTLMIYYCGRGDGCCQIALETLMMDLWCLKSSVMNGFPEGIDRVKPIVNCGSGIDDF
jgi:hypothetical protein